MAERGIIRRIDESLQSLPGVDSGVGDYAGALEEFERAGRDGPALQRLRAAVVESAARRYWSSVGRPVELLEMNDGDFDVVYDRTLERTVLVHGLTRSVTPVRHGRAARHAAGPGPAPQLPRIDRWLSDRGRLWRAIETHLAAHAGLFAFARLIYPPAGDGAVPDSIEYGLLNGRMQFRAVVFPNG